MSGSEKKPSAAKDDSAKERIVKTEPTITFAYEYMEDTKLVELGFGQYRGVYTQLKDDVTHLLKNRKQTDKKLVIFPKAQDNAEITSKVLIGIGTALSNHFRKVGLDYRVSLSQKYKSVAFLPKKEKRGLST